MGWMEVLGGLRVLAVAVSVFCCCQGKNKYRFHPLSFWHPHSLHPQWLPNKGSWQKEKKNYSREEKNHPPKDFTPHRRFPPPQPRADSARRRRRRWRSWLRTLRTSGLQDYGVLCGTPGRIQAARATIKISKIHHWKNGRKKKHSNGNSNNNAPLQWPCFLYSLIYFFILCSRRLQGFKIENS